MDIESIKKNYKELLDQLSSPELFSDWEKFEELSKRKITLEKILDKERDINDIKNRIEENKAILNAGEDSDLNVLAETEINQLQEKLNNLEKDFKNLLSEEVGEKTAPMSAIIEIRAGAGGDEAGLFARDLYEMYSKYAQIQGWTKKILDSNQTEVGGFKEIIFELKGDVYSKMRYEGGVHRVQRIPETEKQGRVHTSTASVAVLPRPKKSQIKINPGDLKIDVYRSSGPGGQNVNKRETAIRITHLPSGLVVASQNERNQLQNKENAMAILEVRLAEKKEQEEIVKIGNQRNSQIGTADRSEKIRTYNFPQDRITDHRIKKNFHNIEEIMEGKLDVLIEAMQELNN